MKRDIAYRRTLLKTCINRKRKFLSHGKIYFRFIFLFHYTACCRYSIGLKDIRHNNLKRTEIETKTTTSKGVDKVINTINGYYLACR